MLQENTLEGGQFVAPLMWLKIIKTALYFLESARIVRFMSTNAHITPNLTAAPAGGLSALLLLLSSL